MEKFILSLDQGTSSSRALLVDKKGNIRAKAQKEFPQLFPREGWVEHDPAAIWSSQVAVATEAMSSMGINGKNLAGIGITNQRETTIIWDRESGKPIYNAIVWQDRRTSDYCRELIKNGLSGMIKMKTGLVIDSYFSATKIKWILDNVPGARKRAEMGKLAFGTVDSWLVWNLTRGRMHITEVTNASRTLLFNIHDLCWDKELLEIFSIPESLLPAVKSSSEIYDVTNTTFFASKVPIAGMAGDQQAALFGQQCLDTGMAKNTYGTGCFVLLNTGEKAVSSENNMISTIAWQINNKTCYAQEGSIFNTGTTIQWLRDELGLIRESAEIESLAQSVPDNGGVYFVPAFTGLGAPHWDSFARGCISGLTRGANKAHLARAALESIAFQTKDVLAEMEKEPGVGLTQLRVDGGASVNNLLMQFQADILGIPVIRPLNTETTAMGAAFLAGLATGYWNGTNETQELWKEERSFAPNQEKDKLIQQYAYWKKAVERSKDWEDKKN